MQERLKDLKAQGIIANWNYNSEEGVYEITPHKTPSEIEVEVGNNDPTHLKQVIYRLETELEDAREDQAKQQLTGYAHAKRGYSLIMLIDSMGLTKKEWKEIKYEASNIGLSPDEYTEINEYFKKK